MRSPITWFGGKGKLVKKLMKYVPEHNYYLEPYGGGASLLFAKEPAGFEVYNDIDSRLVNLFRVLRDKEKFERFYMLVCLTPYSREEFAACRNALDFPSEDDVENAYRMYVSARMAFSGQISRCTNSWSHTVTEISRNMSGAVSRWLSAIELLPEIHARLMRVQIEHLPALECIEKYGAMWDYNNSFIYLDPPYIQSARRSGGYDFEMTDKDHKELIDYLIEHQDRNKFMLSGYDNKIYQRLERKGWRKICWEVTCNAAGRTRFTKIIGENATFKKNQRRIECIWINYDLASG